MTAAEDLLRLATWQVWAERCVWCRRPVSFSEAERLKVADLLKELKLDADEGVVLIDCRDDNKPSASNAK